MYKWQRREIKNTKKKNKMIGGKKDSGIVLPINIIRTPGKDAKEEQEDNYIDNILDEFRDI